MPVNITALQTQVSGLISALSSTATAEDLLLLSLAVKNLDTNRVISVPTINDLPDLYSLTDTKPDPGTIFLIEQYDVPVVAGTQSWLGLDGRVARKDVPSYTAWGWGSNGAPIGDGTNTNRCSPTSVIGNFTDWCIVNMGNPNAAPSTLGLKNNGTLWSWGNPSLGNNTTTGTVSPVRVSSDSTDWCAIGQGAFAIKCDGTLWSWGCNTSGQLGDGTTINTSSPISVIGGFVDWCQISNNFGHSLAVRKNGTLWAWGKNASGKLGDGTILNKSSPVSVVGNFTDWCQASAGYIHSLGIRTNGTAWAWGNNTYGRLGNNSVIGSSSPVSVVGGFTDWCHVATGYYASTAVRSNGTAWAWGYSPLGDGTACTRSSPVSIVGGFTNWCKVAAGYKHAAGIRTDGTLWAWGWQPGDGTTVIRLSPVSVVGGITTWSKLGTASICGHIAIRTL